MSGRHLLICFLLALLCLLPAAPCPAASEVVCVFDRDYPPFSYIENGQPAGFEIDLVRAAAKQAGIKLVLRPLPWGQAQGQMAVGHAQIIAGMSPTPERRRLYIFLDPPNAMAKSVIVARQGGEVRVLDDLAGRRVGALKGSNQVDQLKARPRVEIALFDSEALALKAVAEDLVDAAAATDVTARHSIADHGLKGLFFLDQPLDSEPLHFALAPSQIDLAERLDAALKALRASGEYERLRKRWLDQ
jgi:ABC-type amino acid transport substrate-binding protein